MPLHPSFLFDKVEFLSENNYEITQGMIFHRSYRQSFHQNLLLRRILVETKVGFKLIHPSIELLYVDGTINGRNINLGLHLERLMSSSKRRLRYLSSKSPSCLLQLLSACNCHDREILLQDHSSSYSGFGDATKICLFNISIMTIINCSRSETWFTKSLEISPCYICISSSSYLLLKVLKFKNNYLVFMKLFLINTTH